MASSKRCRCARCEREVEVRYQYTAPVRRWLKVYLYIPLLMLPALPFLAGDFAVSLPLMMAYMFGIGPALTIIKDPPICCECDAWIPAAAR